VPFAIFVSLAAVTVLYVSLQLVAQVLLGSDLTGSKAPLVEAAGRISPVLAAVVAAGAAISMIGYLASNVLAAPRMLFGMARDGLLPRGVAGVRSASHAPVAAIALHAGLVMVLAITGAFAQLVVLATLVTLVAYALGCVSAYLLQRRRVALQGRPLNARLTPAAAGLGLIAIVWVALQGTWTEAGAVFAAALLASVYFVLWTRTHRPPTVRG
jgi:amino acid transporter